MCTQARIRSVLAVFFYVSAFLCFFLHLIESTSYSDKCAPFLRSQYEQDSILLKLLDRNVDIAPFYLDLASNHYEDISNSYMLDKCLGWRGICIEPLYQYYADLLRYRTCQIFPTCISHDFEEVIFIQAGVYAGIQATNKNVNGTEPWQISLNERSPRKTMQCVPLRHILKRSGVTRIGFLSLDVEGHELPVLNGVSWSDTEIDVIAVESNTISTTSLLKEKGYTHLEKEIYISTRLQNQLAMMS